MRYLVQLIGECVEQTSAKQYLYGPAQEVLKRIADMNKTAESIKNKYPLIFMPTDIEESRGERSDLQSTIIIPSIVILNATKKEYYAEQRYENNYKTVLVPIYKAFLTAIAQNVAFGETDDFQIKHNYIERYSWGKYALFQESGINADFIDAIEIKNLELTIKRKIC